MVFALGDLRYPRYHKYTKCIENLDYFRVFSTRSGMLAKVRVVSCRLWLRDIGQRFVLTTSDSQQSTDPELRVSGRSAYIKL